MSRNTNRAGRRRRVLNEEILTGGAGRTAQAVEPMVPGDTPRYGAGANIENHPQVTDFVPRRYRAFASIVLLVVAVGGVAETASRLAPQISTRLSNLVAADFAEVFSTRLLAWMSAVLLLATAVTARVVFSLRRHRVDDCRGRYRVWRLASWLALFLSLNAVTQAHAVIAAMLGGVSGWELLPGHVGWWLAPAVLVGGWMLVRLARDASECRSALSAYVLAILGYVVAGVESAGFLPVVLMPWAESLVRQLPLAANLFLLVGTLLFARYLVLDVQGLIAHSPQVAPARTVAPSSTTSQADQSAPSSKTKPEPMAWVDGSEPELSEAPDGSRRLTKAQRKQRRKQQRRHAA